MGRIAHWTTGFVRKHVQFKSTAHAVLNFVPDFRITRSVKGVGPIRYRMRRHHYFWTRPLLDDSSNTVFGILQTLIHSGDVVYDIGANIGLYSRIMLQWHHAGKVIAFEPMSDNVELLKENARLAPDPSKLLVFPTALGDRIGFEELQIDDVSSGTAVLSKVSGGQAAKVRRLRDLPPLTELIPIWRLDDLVAQEQLPLPDVMKIDTEGAGGMVLRGAVQTIEASSPRMVIAVHGEDECRSLLEVLIPLSYYCYSWVPRDGKRIYTQIKVEDAVHFSRGELCCSRKEADVNTPPERLRQIPQAT